MPGSGSLPCPARARRALLRLRSMPGPVPVRSGSLDDHFDEWIAAWNADPSATPFHRPEFLRGWWDEFSPAATPLVVRAGGGFATAMVEGETLRFLGDPDVTDYMGPIGTDRDAVAEALARAAAGIDGWTTADLPCLATGSGWPEAIARAAKDAGFEVADERHDVCPRIALTGGFDAYLAALPSKLRHEIRRKERRLEREAGRHHIRLSTTATLDADLERFFAMHRASDGPKGKFLHEGMAGFFTRVAHSFEQLGWLRLCWLDLGGEPAAGTLAFAARGTWFVYNSVYDHARRDLAPGMVLMGETIRLATEEGCHTFDMLRGDEAYKYRFGAAALPLVRLTLQRRDGKVSGRAGVAHGAAALGGAGAGTL